MRRADVLPNVLILIASTALALLAPEGGLRWLHTPEPTAMTAFRLRTSDYYQPDPQLGWIPRPNARGTHQLKRTAWP